MLRHKRLVGPLILFLAISVSITLSALGVIPQIGNSVKEFFLTVGLWVLPIIVFVEYLYGVNFFFPGALTIIFAMASTEGQIFKAVSVFLIIWIFSLLGMIFSFTIGRFQSRLSDLTITGRSSFVKKIFILCSYAHPLTASIRAFQQGANHVTYRNYLLELVALNFIWNLFWGIISYCFGAVITAGNTFAYLLFFYSIYWFYQEWKSDTGVSLIL